MKKLHIIAVIILCTLFVSCSAGSVAGKWQRAGSKEVTEFTSDGKIAFYSDKGQKAESEWIYTADSPGKITITDGNTNPKCLYKIEGSKLTMNCSASKGADFPKDFADTNGTQMTFEKK
jgi:hypothetical protein